MMTSFNGAKTVQTGNDWDGYNYVLNNREFTIEDRVNYLAGKAETVRIGVGYFYLTGFELIQEQLQNASKVELLIGVSTSAETITEIQKAFADQLEAQDKQVAADNVSRLYELIQHGKVDVRVYTERQFHPKAYIFSGMSGKFSGGRALIGSSNASVNGLRENEELAGEITDPGRVEQYISWFNELWGEAEPFSTEVMEREIQRSQFNDIVNQVTTSSTTDTSDTIPITEAVKAFLATELRDVIADGTFYGDNMEKYIDKLTPFQKDAFYAAKHAINTYGGVILADSVGLGKSYIAAPLIQSYTSESQHVLIIAPKRLQNMWMEEYVNSKNGTFPVQAQITFLTFDEVSLLSQSEIQAFRDVDFILIDEAHDFRNTGKKRYEKLQSIGQRNKKFVLLTATPIHNSISDLKNILNIFVNDIDFKMLSQQSMAEIFNQYSKLANETTSQRTQKQELRFEECKNKVKEILNEVVIARDRKYIIDQYDTVEIDGETIGLPTRNPEIVTAEDPRRDELYKKTVNTVLGTNPSNGITAAGDDASMGLNLPHISTRRYESDLEAAIEEEHEIEYRGASILLLLQLLKQLESSYTAFIETVNKLIVKERATKQIVTGTAKDDITLADVNNILDENINTEKKTTTDTDADDDTSTETTPGTTGQTSRNTGEITSDIDSDIEVLQELIDEAKRLRETPAPGENTRKKTEQLQTIIEGNTHDKILIFTQYINTAKHIFEAITDSNADQQQIGTMKTLTTDRTIGYVHGGDGFKEEIVNRFAPDGTRSSVPSNEEIDVLITTDVLNSGHNLQDARVLINYDLRWNPMKIEQRIGRIDRITTNHTELSIYNFVPTGELSSRLGIMETIQDKLTKIKTTFRQSAPILEQANEKSSNSTTTYGQLLNEETPHQKEDLLETTTDHATLRNAAEIYCDKNNIDVTDLQTTQKRITEQETPILFRLPETGHDGVIIVTEVTYNTGREEIYTRSFNTGTIDYSGIDNQTHFTTHPQLETDPVAIFEVLTAELPCTAHKTITPELRKNIQSFINDLSHAGVWENKIINDSRVKPDIVKKVENACDRVIDRTKCGDAVTDAKTVKELLDEYVIGSYAQKELQTLYSKRTCDDGFESIIPKIKSVLTTQTDLNEQEYITDVSIILAGASPDAFSD